MDIARLESMLRLCAATAEMPGWNDALAAITETVQRGAEKLSDDELWMVAAGVKEPRLKPDKGVSLTPFEDK